MFNGIDELTTRADFLDRAIIITLAKISNEQRKSEAKLDKDFENDYSDLFGGIICLVSPILKILPTIQDNNLPRMTELARFGIALEKVLELNSGTFLNIFNKNSLEKSDSAFWNDEICTAIYNKLSLGSFSNLKQNNKKIEGNLSKIREDLAGGNHQSGRKTYLTKTVSGFAGQLKRIEPLLNTKGIIVERLPRAKLR